MVEKEKWTNKRTDVQYVVQKKNGQIKGLMSNVVEKKNWTNKRADEQYVVEKKMDKYKD